MGKALRDPCSTPAAQCSTLRMARLPSSSQRAQDMLVGQLLPAEAADWSAEATGGQVLAEEPGGDGGAQPGGMEIIRIFDH